MDRVPRGLEDVARQRLANQFLLTRPFAKPADVVRALGAVQAQDYAGAKWALALRMRRVTQADIERAMTDAQIIRTHVLRPTWHLVAAEDLRWMLALTAPHVSKRMTPYNRHLELDAALFRRSNDAMARALEGGQQLTRQELANVLRKAGINPGSVQRLAHLAMQAELDAVVCSGAVRGKQFTYALLDTRVPHASLIGRDEAIVRLTRLYFASRSPATVQDFAWWSGLPVGDARRGIQMTLELQRETIAGRDFFMARPNRARLRSPTAHLLPNYDEYFIGHKDRSAIGERLRAAKAKFPQGSAFWNVVAIDGQLVGGWKRVVRSRGYRLDIRIITRINPAERRALVAAARQYADFLAVPTEIQGL